MLHQRPATVVPALFTALLFGGSAASQAPVESKLVANDAAAKDEFGVAVAVDGDTAVVGAWEDDDAGNGSGSAHVFVHNGTTWVWQDKLTASDAAMEDYFGFPVAISGDTVLVGAFGDNGSNTGSAYVFVRNGTTWSEQDKLTASDAAAGDFFGVSVALDGDIAVIGAPGDDDAGSFSGSAYVFVRNGSTWSEQDKLKASDAAADDQFGNYVGVSGETAVVGADYDDDAGDSSGAAYVFVRNGTTWGQQTKLTASDAEGDDRFGRGVAVSGDTAVISARNEDERGSNAGAAYVFVRNGTIWSEQDKLTASDAEAQDLFGTSVALHGDTAIVGAESDDFNLLNSPGSAYVFLREGTAWNEVAKLTASDADTLDRFGVSVGLSGNTAIVGSFLDDDGGDASGSAYVYDVPLARVSTFGMGCAGTLATPVLQAATNSRPKTGETFQVVLSSLPAGNRAFLVLGLSSTQWLSSPLPMSLATLGAPGCSLLVSGDFFTPVVNTGTATQGFPIPLDPSLIGLHIYFQGYVEDPGANFFGIAVSNGLDILIGSR